MMVHFNLKKFIISLKNFDAEEDDISFIGQFSIAECIASFIEYPDNDIGARNNKTLIYKLAPSEWEYILYLDADTEVVSSDVTFLFDINFLNNFKFFGRILDKSF